MRTGQKKLMAISIAGAAVSSLPVLLLPWASYDPARGSVALAYVVGILFWLGLIMAYGSLLLLARRVKAIEARRPTAAGARLRGRPGFFRLASNKYALAADAVLAVSIIANILFLFGLVRPPELLTYAAIALLLLSLHLHGLLNGRYFRYVSASENRRAKHEKA